MELKTITLLSEEEYIKYKFIIPRVGTPWWLKTPDHGYRTRVRVVCKDGFVYINYCESVHGAVRPACVFNFKPTNPLFWCKTEKLIGAKFKFRGYNWTILDIYNNGTLALCDEIIARHRFDENTNVWEISELKQWLETEGLKLINA